MTTQVISRASHQGHLERALQIIFPDHNIEANARNQVKNPVSGNFLELDMWIPTLNIAFEFQDVYHYFTAWYAHDPLHEIQTKDYKKFELIRKHGIDIILVPFWWDTNPESLQTSINFQAPWITQSSLSIIPLNPPPKEEGVIPEIGEVMLATFVDSISSHFYNNPIDKWWMGEKYDGIRSIWNPNVQLLFSRNGNILQLPRSHITTLSSFNTFLDSEIWFGRGMYLETQLLVYPTTDPQFDFLRMIVFDAPIRSTLSYEKRYKILLSQLSFAHPFSINAFRMGSKTQKHLQKILKTIIEGYGEGVIMQKIGSLYEKGRSSLLLKIKSSQADAEGLVLDVHEETISLKLPSGHIVESFYHPNMATQTQKGDIVTFEFESSSRREIPTNPIVTRIRKDLCWDDVIREYSKLNSSTRVFAEVPRRYWKVRSGKNMRTFFEQFAKNKNLDPLAPETWYSLSRKDFEGTPGASFLHSVGYVSTVCKLFSDIGLDPKKFPNTPHRFWTNMENRKQFFDNIATEKGFDPRVPEHWYSFTRSTFKNKGDPLREYSGRIGLALAHVYPDVTFDQSKFPRPMGYWKETANRKKFFDDFAAELGFDPLIPKNWYSIRGEQLEEKGAGSFLKYSKSGFVGELMESYPNIGFDLFFFDVLPRNFWDKEENRRRVLTDYARKKSADSLSSTFWSSVYPTTLKKEKHASSMLSYYGYNLKSAIADLFPQIEKNDQILRSG